jgi:hypothetical protein
MGVLILAAAGAAFGLVCASVALAMFVAFRPRYRRGR